MTSGVEVLSMFGSQSVDYCWSFFSPKCVWCCILVG